jgi:hypothetical protein
MASQASLTALLGALAAVVQTVSRTRAATAQAAQAEADLRVALAAEQRTVEPLRVALEAMRGSCANAARKVLERDLTIVALRLRLSLQRRSPGRIDIESDPTVERDANAIVCSAYCRSLRIQNAKQAEELHTLRVSSRLNAMAVAVPATQVR